MHFAAKLGRFQELKAMLDNGGNPFLKNKSGETIEGLLKTNPTQQSQSTIVQEILNEAEQLKQRTTMETNESLVHSAVRKKDLKILKLYSKLGASLQTLNLKDQTPRELAAELGFHEIVQYIDDCNLNSADEVTHL